ncbi:hypothetical protein LB452_04350 [Psychroflexus sp. CAK8W]|uniref:Uncharacterized protein n=1 Tax=Psychroflexus longus TaxID=2873596 RepID=A0ABS7XGR3_9FLAO|nr:hypothetical protein [Psychroflexus longus]MBZ9778147.1 hypothetical protein [Psychroflexus longus]
MKKIFSYLLIFLFTMQSFGMNIGDVSSFYNLVNHYQLHKTNYNNSFNDFLDLHYGSKKEAHSNEHEEHENLPFQDVISSINTIYFTTPELVQLLPVHIEISSTKNFNYQDFFSTLHTTEILQPPKA